MRNFNDRMRGHFPDRVQLIESRIARIRGVLKECGIELVSVWQQPEDISFENRKFTVLGEFEPVDKINERIKIASPEVKFLESTPLIEKLGEENPEPFVIKRPQRDQRGVNKFLINRPDQIEKLKQYFSNHSSEEWIAEPYIQTPGNTNSSYRITATAAGTVISSALIYRQRDESKKVIAPFEEREIGSTRTIIKDNREGWVEFADAHSEWFLNSDVITSNAAHGGLIIPLKIDGKLGCDFNLFADEKLALKAHGLQNLETPKQLIEQATAIAREVGPAMSLIVGIDFIQDAQGNFYLLEVNPEPGTDSVLTWWGINPNKVAQKVDGQKLVQDDLIRVFADSLSP